MEALRIFCVLILFAVHSFCIPIETHRSGRLPFFERKQLIVYCFFRTGSVRNFDSQKNVRLDFSKFSQILLNPQLGLVKSSLTRQRTAKNRE